MKHIIIVFFALIAVLCSNSHAQGYKIDLKVNGLADSAVYLGYYYGKYQYVRDTARLSKYGTATFETKDTVLGGVYFIILPKQKFFEIIIDKDRNPSLECDAEAASVSLKAKKSDENAKWFEYKTFIESKGLQMERLIAKQKIFNESKNKDSLQIINEKIKKTNEDVARYKDDYEKKYPKSLMATIFKSSNEVQIPAAPILPNGKKDSLFTYQFYKNHYWDNFDFSDDRILRTPLYHTKLEQYITKVLPQIPDSLNKAIDVLIDKVAINKEMYKYTVWYITHHFETTQVMGMDAVFCFIVDKVYRKGKAFWVSENVNKRVIEAADKKLPNLIGKVAPELILLGINKDFISLHSIKSEYTIIYFWDPACGHCKTETPKLIDFYKKVKDTLSLKIYAVCIDTNLTEWRNTITQKNMNDLINVNGTYSAKGNFRDLYDIYSTPVVYILDNRKKIIAKRIPVDQISDFINFYRKHPVFSE